VDLGPGDAIVEAPLGTGGEDLGALFGGDLEEIRQIVPSLGQCVFLAVRGQLQERVEEDGELGDGHRALSWNPRSISLVGFREKLMAGLSAQTSRFGDRQSRRHSGAPSCHGFRGVSPLER
jgi:hypothetical protein